MIQPMTKYFASLAGNRWYQLQNSTFSSTNFGNFFRCIWSASGSFSNFAILLSAAPGVGNSWTIALRNLAGVTACSVTISDTDTTGRYTGAPVTISAGDFLDYQVTSTGAPASADAIGVIEFDSDEVGVSGYTSNFGTMTTGFLGGFGMFNNVTLNFFHSQYVSTSGNITALFGGNTFTAVPAGVSVDCYVYKNGVKQDGSGVTIDTRLQITNIAAFTAVSNSFTLPVVRGDTVYVGTEVVGAYPASWTTVGLKFTADIDGESIYAGVIGGTPSAASVNYANPNSCLLNWSSTEAFSTKMIAGVTSFTLKDLYFGVDTNPGVGNTREFNLRKNGGNSSISALITDSILEVSDSNSMSCVDGDIIGALSHTPFSTPTVTGAEKWSLIISTTETPGIPSELPLATEIGAIRVR
jgi:hypothetical protein